ncbi:Gfo/Idh/MocA family protein [Thalassospira lucentensis]|uniref:Gfo/Idh/MocA family protein n=1 Tax=Thalassospira lucentensis TaxID=168935 RepID=UPI003D275AF3
MRVLVSGLGSIGCRHARNFLSAGVDEIIGYDPDEGRRTKFSSEFSARTFASLESAICEEVDLAVIASPNIYHVSQSIVCAKASVNLFIEKPLGCSDENLDLLSEVIKTNKLFCHVGSNWKYHPAFIQMKDMLERQAFGKPLAVKVLAGQWLPSWHPYEDYRTMYAARSNLGGGIHFDTHELDYLVWMFGKIKSINGSVLNSGVLEIDTADLMSLNLQFEGGVVGGLQADYLQVATRREYCITCEKGTIDWDIRASTIQLNSLKGRNELDVSQPLGAMYIAQTNDILQRIQNSQEATTSFEQAKYVLGWQLFLNSIYTAESLVVGGSYD